MTTDDGETGHRDDRSPPRPMREFWNERVAASGHLGWEVTTTVSLIRQLSGKSILDFGCGAGAMSALLSTLGADVTGVDFSPKMIESARARYGENTHLRFMCA